MPAHDSTLVLEGVPRPLYVSLMKDAAREALPLERHVRNLLVEVAERPDPLDVAGDQQPEG